MQVSWSVCLIVRFRHIGLSTMTLSEQLPSQLGPGAKVLRGCPSWWRRSFIFRAHIANESLLHKPFQRHWFGQTSVTLTKDDEGRQRVKLTVSSAEHVASRESSNGEKSKSVTRSGERGQEDRGG